MKRTITINDNLAEIMKRAINNTENVLSQYIEQNPSKISTGGKINVPCLDTDLDYDGTIHQIVDQAVPIYDQEIKDLWYLYEKEFEKAYDNAGIGDREQTNWRGAAIYFYIYEQLRSWYDKKSPEITEREYRKYRSTEMQKLLNKNDKNKTLNISEL